MSGYPQPQPGQYGAAPGQYQQQPQQPPPYQPQYGASQQLQPGQYGSAPGQYQQPQQQYQPQYGAPQQQYQQPPQQYQQYQPQYGATPQQQYQQYQPQYGAVPSQPQQVVYSPPTVIMPTVVQPVAVVPMMMVQPGYNRGYFIGTITHDCRHDAEILRKAMKGLGTDEKALICVLANRNWSEREAIKREFAAKYSKDLIRDVKSEVSGNFKKCLVALLTEPAQYDANQLHKACEGLGTNENTLIEILVTRSNAQKDYIRQLYQAKYGKSLKNRIESETSGDFKKLMERLCEPRDESPVLNPTLIYADSEALYKAGEGKIGTDEKVFIKILTERSLQHIAAIASEYVKHHKKHTLLKAIDSEFSGSTRVGLLAIVSYAVNPYGYFAEILKKSIEGLGTNDNKLIRTVVTQCHNIPSIKIAYANLYKNSLSHDIAGDCSGDYKKLLLDIIN